MLIVCPTCATSYQVDAASLAPTGRSVRCARCKKVWFAAPPTEQTPAAAFAEAGDAAETSGGAGAAPADPSAMPAEAGSGQVPAAALDETADWADALNIQMGGASDAGRADSPVEPVAADDAPPLIPDAPADPLFGRHFGDDGTSPQDVESLAARRQRRQAADHRRRWAPSLPLVILLLLAGNAAVINWRAEIARAFPQTASLFAAIGLPVNLRGLEFANVTVTRERHEGMPVLVVDGVIISVARTPVEVPRLRLAIRNANGAEIYTWTALPTRNVLAPGEQLPFRSRLASPPAEGREVIVRFFNRRDLAAHTR